MIRSLSQTFTFHVQLSTHSEPIKLTKHKQTSCLSKVSLFMIHFNTLERINQIVVVTPSTQNDFAMESDNDIYTYCLL